MAACVRLRTTAACLAAACVLGLISRGAHALPPTHPAMRLLRRADRAIRDSKAAEAVEPLREVVKLFPKTPEADRAEALLNKIGSLEVLFDRSHEWRGETHTVSRYLRTSGIGVTISDASLEHLRDRLGDYEMILIWQQSAGVSFTDVEIVMLKEYVKEGGRLLLIGTARPTGPYPLRKLLGALGCPLRAPQVQVNFGRGRVKFFDNSGLFDSARLADARESRQEVIEIFEKVMPYEQLGTSGLDDYVGPESEETLGPVTLQYSGRLKTAAERTKELIEKITEEIQLVYKDELDEGLTVRLLPRDYSGWAGAVVFAPGALQRSSDVARELARAFALYALFPEGTWIHYPPWVTNGWCDLVGLRICFKMGFKVEAEVIRRGYMTAFTPGGADDDALDLSVSRHGHRWDYIGKAQWTLESLERRHRNLLPKLRRTLKEYAATGRVGDAMSTRSVIFYLSQATHTDMFHYFQSIGTSVLPMKLDYYELEKAGKKD